MLLVAQIVSILIAGVGGLLGILYEFRYSEGPRRGRVSRAGKGAAFLLIGGLTINIVTTVQSEREKARSQKQESQQRTTLMGLTLQDRQVRNIRVVIYLSETSEAITSNWTLLTSLKSRNNGTYLFTFPYGTIEPRKTLVEPSVSIVGGSRLKGVNVSRIDNLFHFMQINLSDTGGENWLLPIFGDLMGVTHTLAVPKTQYEENKIELFKEILQSINAVAIFFDEFPVHIVRRPQFSPTLAVSDLDNPQLLKVLHSGAKFYQGSPSWSALSQATDPESVVPDNKLAESLRQLGIGPKEPFVTIEPKYKDPK